MRNSNKKGFTIVELVIVIAVIAILAAVLIPTFSGVIAKANLSADQKAVHDMNTALAIYTDGVDGIADAKIKLADKGIDAENYKPLSNGYEFYFVPAINSIVLVDANDVVIFPENLKEKATADKDNWKSLSGNGNEEKVEEMTTAIANGSNVDLSGTTNMMGASINLKPTQNITIGGTESAPATITNFVSDEGGKVASNKGGAFEDNKYNVGLIGLVPDGKTVTVENLNITDAVIGDTTQPNTACVGIIAGKVEGTLIIKNVTIDNCTVFGSYKVGALVGEIRGNGKVVIMNVTVKNTTVKGNSTTAALIGYANGVIEASSVTCDVTVGTSEFNASANPQVVTVGGEKYIFNDRYDEYEPAVTSKYWWDINNGASAVEKEGYTIWDSVASNELNITK